MKPVVAIAAIIPAASALRPRRLQSSMSMDVLPISSPGYPPCNICGEGGVITNPSASAEGHPLSPWQHLLPLGLVPLSDWWFSSAADFVRGFDLRFEILTRTLGRRGDGRPGPTHERRERRWPRRRMAAVATAPHATNRAHARIRASAWTPRSFEEVVSLWEELKKMLCLIGETLLEHSQFRLFIWMK